MTPLADMEADMEISSVASNRGMNADDLNERHTIGALLKAAELIFLHPRYPSRWSSP